MSAPELRPGQHAVYAYFDVQVPRGGQPPAAEHWLYVGFSNDPERRLAEHRREKPWFDEVRGISILEVTDSEPEARRRERFWIEHVRPRHNDTMNPDRRTSRRRRVRDSTAAWVARQRREPMPSYDYVVARWEIACAAANAVTRTPNPSGSGPMIWNTPRLVAVDTLAPGVWVFKLASRDSVSIPALAAKTTEIAAKIIPPRYSEQAIVEIVPQGTAAGQMLVAFRDPFPPILPWAWPDPHADHVVLGRSLTDNEVKFFLPGLSANARHALIGASTGGGKSTRLDALIPSVAYLNQVSEQRTGHPALELWGIDMKRVELSTWRPLFKHLAVEGHQVIRLLTELIREMIRREQQFEGVFKNLSEARRAGHQIPGIVAVIDEYASVKALSDSVDVYYDTEQPPLSFKSPSEMVVFISERARAVGITLVLCTQTPRHDVIPTRLRNNLQ
ncbi:MAG: FtsK/SpoIIIE domain-containing protein, partial [Actinomycetota bacterium]